MSCVRSPWPDLLMISARGPDSASADEPGVDVRAPLRVARQTPRSDQCDINVGLVIEASIPRVVPPRMNSRSRECPYPPMTMRSGYVSAAYDRIVFETSILPTGMG